MRHALLLSEFACTPWAMLPDRLATLTAVMVRWALEQSPAAGVMEQVQADVQARNARASAARASAGGGIAVLPFYGIVTQRPVQNASGPGTMSTQMFAAALSDATDDDTVSGIVVDFDSPGGSIFGVSELAGQFRAARAKKPVYGVSNSVCGSAAYWVASNCSQLFAAPDSLTGSVGCYIVHEDVSKALEAQGVKMSFVSAGKYKVEGNSFEPLGDEARAHIQSVVDAGYGAFTRDVAHGRGVPVSQVRDSMGQGRALLPDAAKAAGMVDGVMSLGQVIGKMQSDLRASRGPAMRAAARAREIDSIGG
jgi:signal peptide peptidase SppA